MRELIRESYGVSEDLSDRRWAEPRSMSALVYLANSIYANPIKGRRQMPEVREPRLRYYQLERAVLLLGRC